MPPRKHAGRTASLLLCAPVLLAAGCTPGVTAGGGTPAANGAPVRASSPPPDVRVRAAIVPRVDHHQHIAGPTAVLRAPPPLPPAALPPELDRVLHARSRAAETGDPGDLYAQDGQVLDRFGEGQPWVRGGDAVRGLVGAFPRGSRFVPNAFAVDGSAAHVSGVVLAGDSPRPRMNFVLGLRKDGGGTWRITSELATEIPEFVFEQPVTGDQLVAYLDEAGIERAAVLSVGYWFGSPSRSWPGDEYANVRAENDWVAAQVARHPGRLVPFCGVSPLREYAVREVRRCATELGMKGVKMHFRSSRVDVLNPEHVARVREVFRTANELGLAIVVHSEGREAYGREQAQAFLDDILPAAPDVPVQIAHLWGGNEFRPAALAVYADAVTAGDPRTRNLYFDLTEIEPGAGGSREAMQEIARRLRQIGLERVLYGSDATSADAPPPVLRWARLRARLPLTDDELRVIADNVAPYMR